MIVFTQEQQRAYARFIRARDRVGLVPEARDNSKPWVRTAEVQNTVDIEGMTHPLFEQNDEWLEYKEASLAWWRLEPEFRKAERMSSIRGDYGSSDSWNENHGHVEDIYNKIKD